MPSKKNTNDNTFFHQKIHQKENHWRINKDKRDSTNNSAQLVDLVSIWVWPRHFRSTQNTRFGKEFRNDLIQAHYFINWECDTPRELNKMSKVIHLWTVLGICQGRSHYILHSVWRNVYSSRSRHNFSRGNRCFLSCRTDRSQWIIACGPNPLSQTWPLGQIQPRVSYMYLSPLHSPSKNDI